MTIASISDASLQATLTGQLQSEKSNLALLSTQLSSGETYTDLTDYQPGAALNLINLQNGITQSQSYTSVIDTVQTRLSGYDTTLTDLESVVAQAQTLVSGNPSYNANTVGGIAATANNLLESATSDLNQQIGGRYIYAGARYTTAPVSNLASLPSSTLSTTIYSDGQTLPVYDSAYAAGTLTLSASGQNVTVGGTVTAGQSASLTVNGTTYSYTETAGDTTTSVATALAALVAADVSGTTASNNVITVGGSGTITNAGSGTASSQAYATDSATISTGFTVNYGISSDNPALQQLVAGLRYLQAAGSATNAASYTANLQQASALLTSALSGTQALHTSVADNINTLTTEKTAQGALINSLTDQIDNISQVDTTQVATEITALETQLQASYSVTGTLEKFSIVSYL